MERISFKRYLLMITYGIVLFIILMNLPSVLESLGIVYSVILPVIYGLVIAYLVNIPYNWFDRKVFSFFKKKGRYEKLSVVLSLISAYALILIIIGLLFRFIIPQLIDSITQLINNIPYYFDSLESILNKFMDEVGSNKFISEQIDRIWTEINDKAMGILKDALPLVGNYVVDFTSGVFNWIVGLFVSVYLLASKDTLLKQSRKLLLAFGPKRYNDRIMELSNRTNLIFYNFITGNMIDSLIIGIVCFIGLSIMRMPYVLLISVIVGVTNLIPIFGPFIGAIPGILIILIVDPFKALLFIIFIFALQQVDGNIIKPNVFGNYVGIPGLWVLISIVVGGGLFGIVGMLLGVPTFALIYSVIKDEVNDRLK